LFYHGLKAATARSIESVGARVAYLPPYSPDPNPIETVFPKFKTLLRKAAQRTVETLWKTCGELIDSFETSECRNHIDHFGYRCSYERCALDRDAVKMIIKQLGILWACTMRSSGIRGELGRDSAYLLPKLAAEFELPNRQHRINLQL
jgi:hypothetical protein